MVTELSTPRTAIDAVEFATIGLDRGPLGGTRRPSERAGAWSVKGAANALPRTSVLSASRMAVPGADGGSTERIGGIFRRPAFDVGTPFAGVAAAARRRELRSVTNNFPTDGVSAVSERGRPG